MQTAKRVPTVHYTEKTYEIEFAAGWCMQINGNNPVSAIATWSNAINENGLHLWEIVRVTYICDSTD